MPIFRSKQLFRGVAMAGRTIIRESSNDDEPPNSRPRVLTHSEFVPRLRLTFAEIHQAEPHLVRWQNKKRLSVSLAFHIEARTKT